MIFRLEERINKEMIKKSERERGGERLSVTIFSMYLYVNVIMCNRYLCTCIL